MNQQTRQSHSKDDELAVLKEMLAAAGYELPEKDILTGSATLIRELLVERIVAENVRPLLNKIEPRRKFIEQYFRMVGRMIDCSIYGIVVSHPSNPWGTLNFSGSYNKSEFDHWLKGIGQVACPGRDLDMEILGELGGKDLLLPSKVALVKSEHNVLGTLIFVPERVEGFDEVSQLIIDQLQVQMMPVMQLLHASQQMELLYDKYRFQVVTDELTGVYNLDFLIGFLQQQLLFSFRQKIAISLLLLEIEGVKEINNDVGWEAGNHVLVQIANWLSNHIRGSDLLARCSGNTFAVILPNTDLKGAKTLGEKFSQQIAKIEFKGGSISSVWAQVGCAQAGSSDINPEVLLRKAQIDLRSCRDKSLRSNSTSERTR